MTDEFRGNETEEEAWLSAEECYPASADEIALERWKEEHWSALFAE